MPLAASLIACIIPLAAPPSAIPTRPPSAFLVLFINSFNIFNASAGSSPSSIILLKVSNAFDICSWSLFANSVIAFASAAIFSMSLTKGLKSSVGIANPSIVLPSSVNIVPSSKIVGFSFLKTLLPSKFLVPLISP